MALAGCGDDDDDGATSPGTTADDVTQTTVDADDASGATLTLVAKDFKFDKSTLTATAGQPVTFVLDNGDTAKHNLTVTNLDVDEDADGGEKATKTVDAPAAGTYEYFCEYHPATMKGTLTVS